MNSRNSILVALLTSFLVACGTSQENGPSPSESKETLRPAPPVSPIAVTRDEVIATRDGARFDPAEYLATETTYRLFGVELGDGTAPKRAIVAETKGWATHVLEEGTLFGRGIRVVRIDESGVTLARPDGVTTTLAPGKEIALRVVRHRFDVASRALGKDRYELDTAAARAASTAMPTSEKAELYGQPVVRLGVVPQGSLLDVAGFREGDLIASLDGAPAADATVAELARALTDGRPSVEVRVYRNGIGADRKYQTLAAR